MTIPDQNPKNTLNPEPAKPGRPKVDTQKIGSDLQAMLVRAAQSAKDSQAGGGKASTSSGSVQPSKPV